VRKPSLDVYAALLFRGTCCASQPIANDVATNMFTRNVELQDVVLALARQKQRVASGQVKYE
jgi:hypothetical protein